MALTLGVLARHLQTQLPLSGAKIAQGLRNRYVVTIATIRHLAQRKVAHMQGASSGG